MTVHVKERALASWWEAKKHFIMDIARSQLRVTGSFQWHWKFIPSPQEVKFKGSLSAFSFIYFSAGSYLLANERAIVTFVCKVIMAPSTDTGYWNVFIFARNLTYFVPDDCWGSWLEERWHVHLPRSVLSFMNSTPCFSTETFKLCYIFICWVNLEISESQLPSINGITAFICPPWDRKATGSSDWPLKRSASSSEHHVCEMLNQWVNT